jgi:hypothetical protein
MKILARDRGRAGNYSANIAAQMRLSKNLHHTRLCYQGPKIHDDVLSSIYAKVAEKFPSQPSFTFNLNLSKLAYGHD